MATKVIDIDGHVAEPITEIMGEYLDPAFKDRPLRLLLDEKGLEYAEIGGKKSSIVQGGIGLGLLAGKAFGAEEKSTFFQPGKVHYYDGMIDESYDPHARVKWMDTEGIDMSFLYPTLGLLWEEDCDDPKTAAAYCRAYNDWLVDNCNTHPDRLVSIAHIPTKDVDEAVREVRRTAKLGVKGFMVYNHPTNGLLYGDPYFDPFYAEVQETGLPLGIHPTTHRDYIGKDVYGEKDGIDLQLLSDSWYSLTSITLEAQVALLNMTARGAFDRFPNLKVVFLETGGAWISYLLERMDDRWEAQKYTCQFELRPSEYFQRQGWIALEPDESLISSIIEEVGANKFFWASDFPHDDGFPGVVGRVKESISRLPEEDQNKVLGDNAIEVYNLN